MANKIKRVIFRVDLTQQTRTQIVELSNEIGVTHVHLASRLVEWFAEQPNKIQLGILGFYPDMTDKDIAKQLLTEIAARH